jgi:hypothetical protein
MYIGDEAAVVCITLLTKLLIIVLMRQWLILDKIDVQINKDGSVTVSITEEAFVDIHPVETFGS